MTAAEPLHGPSSKALTPSWAAAVLVILTTGLIILGALVRAHGAGLACPDWPLCFGQVIPTFDLKVAFEWGHRAAAGSISLIFLGLAIWILRTPEWVARARTPVLVASVLLVTQILLGALTVWELLARWTVTSHLIVGNSFNASVLWLALQLRDEARPPLRAAIGTGLRVWVGVCVIVLFLQMVLGGLVSSGFAGLVCPDWPTCIEGRYYPTWQGPIGIHLAHRTNGYLLVGVLIAAAVFTRHAPRLFWLSLLAAGLVVLQAIVGIANVLLEIPVEVTGLHSALAAALVLNLAALAREAWLAPSPALPASA
ncbi:MAG: COX15/CtaA family protein [Myxococcota bacterium]|nr:COX15/CtaA family protein [Myxococcota bacterium]